MESQTAAASTAACTSSINSSNYTNSNIRISSSMDNGNTSTGSGTNSSTQVESKGVISAKEETAVASAPQSISNHKTNSSSVSNTKHQQSYHQQQ
ncbi:LOW QUALITY PROTEIN: hypothetical protein PoB_003744600 [Plakobranchus ocellatus]|uniref:Uncharacterized protein n=1 Tax=Plakobranchus ocellatus TaxID=259542 RepID=A0AAV4AS08_9GAST|nr:LOW QUALITY PROTEIN: hypothetical protein PoB_003744600 [Plakobranchus ocellatus]